MAPTRWPMAIGTCGQGKQNEVDKMSKVKKRLKEIDINHGKHYKRTKKEVFFATRVAHVGHKQKVTYPKRKLKK